MSTAARLLEPSTQAERPRLRLIDPIAAAEPIVSMRTCTACGAYVVFVETDAARWSTCTACGHDA